MVALVQTLIAVMLIPVAFAAPAANGTTPASASNVSTASRAGHYGHLKVSVDGKCGKKAGSRCGEGSCCSKFDFCGTTKEHCDVGCQSVFGSCDPTLPVRHLKLSRNGKCGRGTNLKCRSDTCCSQFGFCGTTNEHCRADCQSAFGLCDPLSPAIQPLVSH
ncbi:hypothetical protein BASA50_008393 [Batrachochytrium salamandrivorans]|uniref:Chitin-binding type-1 domain-containing protein n=1 Tax=Batrachochytrium salamandrivorans TaxID=1357716 RepID=A0ABQ8F448_9FUNG|nr:hypothetical protein BASA50_008393 [Batrachochytrium salamandrivorans]KAH9267627.1 hypothetical protein BASA83_009842 [Batrachochytrium salamandrivorans]